MIKVGLVFWISNFFINKTYQANNWSSKKIPSCANLALMKITLTNMSQYVFVIVSNYESSEVNYWILMDGNYTFSALVM